MKTTAFVRRCRPLDLGIAFSTARARGGSCLSDTYRNIWTPLRWRCARGHEWSASLGSVKDKGSWCPTCSSRAPLGLEVAQELALARGGRCLSERYINSASHLHWQCAAGHEWHTSLHSVRTARSWCPRCSSSAPLGLEVAVKEAALRGGSCLSKYYINLRTPLHWRCEQGHEWHASIAQIRARSTWCPDSRLV